MRANFCASVAAAHALRPSPGFCNHSRPRRCVVAACDEIFAPRPCVGQRWRHFSASAAASCKDPRDAVVKIFNTRQRPGWTVPWQMQTVECSTGSGAVIARNAGGEGAGGGSVAVLTAAHVVSDSKYVQIQRSTDRFSSEKFRATVIATCHEIDLALLRVEDPSALSEIEPMSVAPCDELPQVFDKVNVVGYPVGGDAVSVTEGVVGRVEVQEYSHSLRPGLALTVDAAINSGNSGGPVLERGTTRIVGVAFQKMVGRGVELQGHAVPAPLIHRFLNEVDAGMKGQTDLQERGSTSSSSVAPLRLRMPSLGCDYQSLEPPALRRAVQLEDNMHGVLVNRLHFVDGQEPALQVDDVMLAFNGQKIDDLGFCAMFGRRLHFAAARDLCATGSTVPLTVFRQGKVLELSHTLVPTRHFVRRGQYDSVPSYFVCGGLVFQPLVHEYLQGWNVSERPPHLQDLFLRGHLTPEGKEAVMLSQVLADEVNAGYDSGWVGAPLVRSVNDVPVRDLRQFRSKNSPRSGAAFQRSSVGFVVGHDFGLARTRRGLGVPLTSSSSCKPRTKCHACGTGALRSSGG